MRICIFLYGIVGIIGGNDLDAGLLCDLDDLLIYAMLVSNPMPHNLQVEVLPKEIFVPQRHSLGLFVAFGTKFEVSFREIEMPIYLPLQTG